MDIYERMKNGEAVDLRTEPDVKNILAPEMVRTRTLCQKINSLPPYSEEVRPLIDEMFEGRLPASVTLAPPFQIDRAHCVTIGERVFINEGLDVMAVGSVTIEDDVMIGPGCTILTPNHDMKDLWILKPRPVVIKKGAWLAAKVVVCPGVTIGESAVIAAGAVVTKDVAPRTVVGGNPARFIKDIE